MKVQEEPVGLLLLEGPFSAPSFLFYLPNKNIKMSNLSQPYSQSLPITLTQSCSIKSFKLWIRREKWK